jgi:predicted transcriptional regulator
MLSVDYAKPFVSLDAIIKIVDLAVAGKYSFLGLVEATSKLLNIRADYIRNSIYLLEDSNLIKVSSAGFCESVSCDGKVVKEKIISRLKERGVLAELANSIELDLILGINKINQFKLFPRYRGVIPLVASLGILIYNSSNDFYELSIEGESVLLSLINENSFHVYDQGLTPEQLANKLSLQELRGDMAEDFVLKMEQMRLKNHPHFDAIKRVSLTNTSAGFDIQSFESIASVTIDKFIEVKSYLGQPGFFWSINEVNFAKEKGAAYCIITVDSQKINDFDYEPSEIRNPYVIFDMEKYLSKNSVGSFDIQLTNFYISPKASK